MTRRSAAGALAVAAAIACTARSEGAGFATVDASVTASPLLVTLSLSTVEGLVGQPVLARASVTNAGRAGLANAAVALRADPSGLRVGGSNPRRRALSALAAQRRAERLLRRALAGVPGGLVERQEEAGELERLALAAAGEEVHGKHDSFL